MSVIDDAAVRHVVESCAADWKAAFQRPRDDNAEMDACRGAYRRAGIEPPRQVIVAGSWISAVVISELLRRSTVRQLLDPSGDAAWRVVLPDVCGLLSRVSGIRVTQLSTLDSSGAPQWHSVSTLSARATEPVRSTIHDIPIAKARAELVNSEPDLVRRVEAMLATHCPLSGICAPHEQLMAWAWDLLGQKMSLRLLETTHGRTDPALFAIECVTRLRPGTLSPSVGVALQLKDLGAWFPLRDIAIRVAEPVTTHLDDDARPHHETGPALGFADGAGLYAWHGTRVPQWVIEKPLTLADIEHQANVELRRILVEKYGLERYVRDSGLQAVHQDDLGTLYRKHFSDDEPLSVVRVVNATPEPDGTRREFWLRVAPQVRSAREAVAWTFGMDALTYQPSVQT